MKLRNKTIMVIGITLGLLVLFMGLSLRVILMDSITALEDKEAREDIKRGINILDNEIRELQSIAADWATWDDSYRFITDHNQGFIDTNLLDSTLIQLKLNIMIFLDNSGHIVYAKSVDLENNLATPFPNSLLEGIKLHPEILRSGQSNRPLTGPLVLNSSMILTSAYPILPSSGEGTVGGTLLIGRYLDTAFIKNLSKVTQLDLAITSLKNIDSLPENHRTKLLSLSKDQPVAICPLNNKFVVAYTRLNDFFGQPSLLMEIQTPRDTFQQGQATTYYAAGFVIAIGMVLGILTLLLLEKLVLSRLDGLSKEVQEIGRGGFGLRVTRSGADELSDLAGSINNMLSDLEDSHLRLFESDNRLQSITDNMLDVISQLDNSGRFEYCSPSCEKVLGYKDIDLLGKSFLMVVHEDDQIQVEESFQKVIHTGIPVYFESRCIKTDGSYLWMETMANVLSNENGKGAGAVLVGRDVTARKDAEERIHYISLHDSLTGLYNRTFFEQEMISLESRQIVPVALIVCDLDGLKFINDTLGHNTGDNVLIRAAKVIKECCGVKSIVSRIGGDEFAVIIEDCSQYQVESIYTNIKQQVAASSYELPDMPIYMSIGFALRNDLSTSMVDLFRQADNSMYREKLHSQLSGHSGVVTSLMQALQERDFITSGHADRLENTVICMGKILGFSRQSLHDLSLLARFHDIGKVGVPDSILLKPGPLSDKEYAQMQQHSEIGYRIARAASDLHPVADWILHHHEWWNGSGYPLGLKGKEIPIECRILAIADAFDSMTNDRPYRPAMSVQQALTELELGAGTQFDPYLVKTFAELVIMGKIFDQSHSY